MVIEAAVWLSDASVAIKNAILPFTYPFAKNKDIEFGVFLVFIVLLVVIVDDDEDILLFWTWAILFCCNIKDMIISIVINRNVAAVVTIDNATDPLFFISFILNIRE